MNYSAVLLLCTQSMTMDKHDPFSNQLLSSDRAIWQIKLKIFGDCGVGKSTLVDSLKCGYIRGLFRQLTSPSSIGPLMMPVSELHTLPSGADAADVEAANGMGRIPIIHGNCTQGVEVSNVNVSGLQLSYVPHCSYYRIFLRIGAEIIL